VPIFFTALATHFREGIIITQLAIKGVPLVSTLEVTLNTSTVSFLVRGVSNTFTPGGEKKEPSIIKAASHVEKEEEEEAYV